MKVAVLVQLLTIHERREVSSLWYSCCLWRKRLIADANKTFGVLGNEKNGKNNYDPLSFYVTF